MTFYNFFISLAKPVHDFYLSIVTSSDDAMKKAKWRCN